MDIFAAHAFVGVAKIGQVSCMMQERWGATDTLFKEDVRYPNLSCSDNAVDFSALTLLWIRETAYQQSCKISIPLPNFTIYTILTTATD